MDGSRGGIRFRHTHEMGSRLYQSWHIDCRCCGHTRIQGCDLDLASCNIDLAGRSAARLARLLREQEVGGSNPLAPTNQKGRTLCFGSDPSRLWLRMPSVTSALSARCHRLEPQSPHTRDTSIPNLALHHLLPYNPRAFRLHASIIDIESPKTCTFSDLIPRPTARSPTRFNQLTVRNSYDLKITMRDATRATVRILCVRLHQHPEPCKKPRILADSACADRLPR